MLWTGTVPSVQMPGVPPLPERRDVRLRFQPLLALAFLLSSVVFIEPAPFDVLIVLLGVALLFRRTLSVLPFQRPAIWLLLGFLLVNLSTVMAASDTVHAFRYLLITTFMVVVFVTLLSYANHTGMPERVGTVLMRAWTWTAVLFTLLGTLAYFGVQALQGLLWYGRILGLFKDPNVYGPFLIPPLLYLLVRLVSAERLGGMRLASVLLLSLGVVLSFSRAAWINALVSAALLLVGLAVTRRRLPVRVRFRRLLPLVALLCGSALVVLAQPATRALLETRSKLQGYDSDRFATQAEALNSFLARPFGIGPGEVELTFNYATHSSYARVAAEYGAPGLLLLICFLVLSVLLAYRNARSGSVLHLIALAALVGLLINSAVVDTIHWRHFWVVLALCWFPIGDAAPASPLLNSVPDEQRAAPWSSL